MTDTPEDWVMIEAAKRCGWDHWPIGDLTNFYRNDQVYRALCDMIAKHEQPPVDRKELCAREANRLWATSDEEFSVEDACLRAIELFEEGFGK
jgi:hypothetical protein